MHIEFFLRRQIFSSRKNVKLSGFAVRLLVCLIFILSVRHTAFTQVLDYVFKPFVSRLEARTSSSSKAVSLTWEDSPHIRGPVFIYRSTNPFGQPPQLAREALIGEAEYGNQTFMDTVPNEGKFFYLAVASDENNVPQPQNVPLNNVIEVFVDGTAKVWQSSGFSTPLSDSPKTPITLESQREVVQVERRQPVQQTATITGISAQPEEKYIRITFLQLLPSKNAVVYRNIVPITSNADVLSSDVVHLPGARSPVMDAAKPGVPYYYAVLYDEDIRNGVAFLYPGHNSTIYPALLPLRQNNSLPSAASSKLSLEAEAALSRDAGRSSLPLAQGILNGPPASSFFEQRPPEIFQQDLLCYTEGTDEYILSKIVQSSFLWRNWQKAIPELQAIIGLAVINGQQGNSNIEISNRAHFYLGQAMFFSGSYSAALTEFLSVQGRFPVETGYWIQITLSYIGK